MAYREGGAEAEHARDAPRLAPHTGLASRDRAEHTGRGRPAFDRTAPGRSPLRPCPELDAVRHRLSPRAALAVERRALQIGVGADQVAIAAGIITADEYYAALAAHLHVPFAGLGNVARDRVPISDEALCQAAITGILPLKADGRLLYVVAPRGLTARRLTALLGARPEMRTRLMLTTPARLRALVDTHIGHAIAHGATEKLRSDDPMLSAAASRRGLLLALAGAAAGGAVGAALVPAALAMAVQLLLAAIFLGWACLRTLALFQRAPREPAATFRLPDDRLPTYTIIAALYQESAAVPGLIDALRALDYPPEKLDIKVVLEADDVETQIALALQARRLAFETIVAPPVGPRTKPKALNIALALARGAYTVVYDAEDRPNPDQLRRALNMFIAGDDDVACVQAALAIDNTRDSLLTRLFTLEYAAQFDALLPGFATLRLPIPLGGSSNHFVTAILRAAGGWDPFNVTEDADLGMRLARFGYRSTTIASTTDEEAPARLGPWIRQRTRWFKGWMQTLIVHMRAPRSLLRDLTPGGFVVFHLVLTVAILAALVQPLFFVYVGAALLTGTPLLAHADALLSQVVSWIYAGAIAAGYATSVVFGLVGLWRRRLLTNIWVLALLPVHWSLLSVAAWRALIQLVRAPHRWEKTSHGLARTSRSRIARSRDAARKHT